MMTRKNVSTLLITGGILLLILNFTVLWKIGPFGEETIISLQLKDLGVAHETSACLGGAFWISLA
jgi:hypothetical protein